ncbi:methylmalonyl-CoA epimerase [bacterium]|jgi:methylmalonyl-CoA/ethylmalonyl-CoA epimerase|nr:methylmalonyl-CoA epimerase [bacterium]
MSVKKIDHLGVAVFNLESAIKIYRDLLGCEPQSLTEVESEGVRVAFFQVGESSIELLEPTRENSPIARFLQKRGEGIHHVCFRVDSLEAISSDLDGKGYRCLDLKPRLGAHNTRVCFFHPKDTTGVLVEFSEDS